jgi:hypothetical protein
MRVLLGRRNLERWKVNSVALISEIEKHWGSFLIGIEVKVGYLVWLGTEF